MTRPTPKKPVSNEKKRDRKVLNLVEKIKILDALADGEKVAVLARRFNVNESSIRTIRDIEKKTRETSCCCFAGWKLYNQIRRKISIVRDAMLSICLHYIRYSLDGAQQSQWKKGRHKSCDHMTRPTACVPHSDERATAAIVHHLHQRPISGASCFIICKRGVRHSGKARGSRLSADGQSTSTSRPRFGSDEAA
ncbi:unnamed protein product [Trichogramma brassicae]|uniref:HTH psq-type domain-containing protein n=1 Tax=Trichogramma brassicae TaxID=86971 RepID=A0A6H5I999_9HYME|nr:unnamed protein product [Trichogramma brassicae]